eukprot:TRINITY_DN9899_c0_g1_i1.p2 TRINITY_DN9899_c0_g1~~TRINITY_DN9899_c0_g1_i1.p2  ORF type:complete len:66 (+),score=21.97 TRINITY_DN9899_c0_g1_i1:471-668(+)
MKKIREKVENAASAEEQKTSDTVVEGEGGGVEIAEAANTVKDSDKNEENVEKMTSKPAVEIDGKA